jgi:hypothetical protein
MEIRFLGLISHVKASNNLHIAVLLTEKNHEPWLRIDPRDIVDDGGNGAPPYRLDGKVLGFSKTGRVDRTGLAGVPSLKRMVLGGNPKKVVLDRTLGPKFAAFVELPGGAYAIRDWFKTKGDATNLGRICVPRTVVLHWDTPGDVTLTLGKKPGKVATRITVKATASILIENAEQKPLRRRGGDFGVHANIVEPETTISMQETTDTCEHGTPATERLRSDNGRAVGVECSNSTYP